MYSDLGQYILEILTCVCEIYVHKCYCHMDIYTCMLLSRDMRQCMYSNLGQYISEILTCVCEIYMGTRYRVAKTHKIPYLHRSFSAKVPIFGGFFVENDLRLRGSYESLPPCTIIRVCNSTFKKATKYRSFSAKVTYI